MPPGGVQLDSVLICGGGVIGAAVAYELACRGVASTIVEADGVASGASGAAAGLLTPPLPWDSSPSAQLGRRGFEMHAELSAVLPADSGVDYGYSRVPRLLLARSPDEEREAIEMAERLAGAGHEGRWLGPAEIRDLTGWIDRPGRGALLVEPWAQLDPYRYTLALVAAAERKGATVRSGRVTGLIRDGDRATGVQLGGEVISAVAVVVAMGPWSQQASGWLGIGVPVEPLRGQIVKVRQPAGIAPFGFSHGRNYAVTRPGGVLYLGTTEEHVGFDTRTTTEAREAILRFALDCASPLEDALLVDQTACLRPLSADGLPIIGRVPGLANVCVATGHGRQGILMSPATGRAVAGLLVDGSTDIIDLEPFDPLRFARS